MVGKQARALDVGGNLYREFIPFLSSGFSIDLSDVDNDLAQRSRNRVYRLSIRGWDLRARYVPPRLFLPFSPSPPLLLSRPSRVAFSVLFTLSIRDVH